MEKSNELIAQVNTKTESNNKAINEKKDQLSKGEGKSKKLGRQIKRLEQSNTDLSATKAEIAKMAGSDQKYDVVNNDNLPFDAGGTTSYSFSNKTVEITLNNSVGIEVFAHEMKHAFQFETGQIDLTSRGGGMFHDQYDEADTFERQSLFGSSLYGYDRKGNPSLPSNLSGLPSARQSNTLKSQSLVETYVYKRHARNKETAYRIDGKTFIFNPNK